MRRDPWDVQRVQVHRQRDDVLLATYVGRGDGTPGKVLLTPHGLDELCRRSQTSLEYRQDLADIETWSFTPEFIDAWGQELAQKGHYLTKAVGDTLIEENYTDNTFWGRWRQLGKKADVNFGRDGVPASVLPESPIGRPIWISREGQTASDAGLDFAEGYAFIATIRWRIEYGINCQLMLPPATGAKAAVAAEVAAVGEQGPLLTYVLEHSDVLDFDLGSIYPPLPKGPEDRVMGPPAPPPPIPSIPDIGYPDRVLPDPLGDVRLHSVPPSWQRMRVFVKHQGQAVPLAVLAYAGGGEFGRVFCTPFDRIALPIEKYWTARKQLGRMCDAYTHDGGQPWTTAVLRTIPEVIGSIEPRPTEPDSPEDWETIPASGCVPGRRVGVRFPPPLEPSFIFESIEETGPIEGEEDCDSFWAVHRSRALHLEEQLVLQGASVLGPDSPVGRDVWYSPEARSRNDRAADFAHAYAWFQAVRTRYPRGLKLARLEPMRAELVSDPVTGAINQYILEHVDILASRFKFDGILLPRFQRSSLGWRYPAEVQAVLGPDFEVPAPHQRVRDFGTGISEGIFRGKRQKQRLAGG